jgi:hypothetical protein
MANTATMIVEKEGVPMNKAKLAVVELWNNLRIQMRCVRWTIVHAAAG